MHGDDEQLAREIESDFAAVYASLKPYERGNGFVSYTALTKADTRRLAQGMDGLAERLGEVPAVIIRTENAGG